MRKLVGLQRHKSSFLLRPCLFLWARTEGCHGDEVGLSPTAWSGKSSSLLWHLPKLEETETIEGGDAGKHTLAHIGCVSNWRLQKADGLKDNTCNIRGLTHTHAELAVPAFISSFYLLLRFHSSLTVTPGLRSYLLSFRLCQRVSMPEHISNLILLAAKLKHNKKWV